MVIKSCVNKVADPTLLAEIKKEVSEYSKKSFEKYSLNFYSAKKQIDVLNETSITDESQQEQGEVAREVSTVVSLKEIDAKALKLPISH